MSRACCTAIIIFISISFSILLRFWTKEYSNSESNKQTPFSPSFLRPPSAERGEIGGKLVTTLETSKSRWRPSSPSDKNRRESGETGFSGTAVPQRRRERRWPSWKTPFAASPSRFPGKEKGPRAGEREVG